MPTNAFERAVQRLDRAARSGFGSEVARLRMDAGLSRAILAGTAGIDASYLADIENGVANPSIETCVRLALALGADFPVRLYPSTGPPIRDRHQSAIAEATLREAHTRWGRFTEIAVRRPWRGWIDLGFHDPRDRVFLATEIQSELRRIEQLVRWSEAKAAALPSWDGWSQLGDEPTISRLLIVRGTRTNRAIVDGARLQLRTAYPADGRDALESLLRGGPWPGAAILWAARAREGGAYRLAARP